MKIRNGFVSNSSSSSFVVAFPRKPESFADVYDMMFNSVEGGISVHDMDGMSHTQIAERVWNDLQTEQKDEWDDKRVPSSKDDIVKQFASRYHYWSADSCVHIWGADADELGGQWSDKGEFWGVDEKTLIKLRDSIIKYENREREIRERQRDIIESEFKAQRPPYAYKGGKNSDGVPYTDEDIKAYEAYCHAESEFKKNHKEYAKLEEEMRGIWSQRYDGDQDKLREKLARADAEAFMKKNKGAFFVTLEYADDGGEATLEHGNIFRNLSHVRISNH